jgi:hypothetical protein
MLKKRGVLAPSAVAGVITFGSTRLRVRCRVYILTCGMRRIREDPSLWSINFRILCSSTGFLKSSCLSSAANEIALRRTPEDLLLGTACPAPSKIAVGPATLVQLQT